MVIFGVFGVFSGKWPFLAIWGCIYIGFKRAFLMILYQILVGTYPKISKMTVFVIFGVPLKVYRGFLLKMAIFAIFGHFGDFGKMAILAISVNICNGFKTLYFMCIM